MVDPSETDVLVALSFNYGARTPGIFMDVTTSGEQAVVRSSPYIEYHYHWYDAGPNNGGAITSGGIRIGGDFHMETITKCGIGEGAIDPLNIKDFWRSSPM